MRGDADHFSASIGSVAPDCFEHQEELLRKHGATSLVVDLRNTPAACADTAIELGAIAASRQPPADGAGSALMSGGAIQSFRAR